MADERVAPDKPPAQKSPTPGTTTETGGASHRRAARMPRNAAKAGKRVAGVLATAVSVATTIVVVVLAVHIVFVAFEANTANDLVRTVSDRAQDLAWVFRDVFQPADRKVEVAVNYGLAALVYLVIGRIVTGLIRRFA
jgi:hypothetical protein